MKKFFGILLAVVSTLILLPGCGGGGDTDPTKVTANEFARGAKMIILQNGLAGWLYVTPDQQFSGYTIVDEKDANGNIIAQEAAAVYGQIGVGGNNGGRAGYTYKVNYDENGVPVTADLTISTQFSQEGNDTLVNFFNQAVGEDGGEVADLRGAPVVKIDFRTNQFTITDVAENDEGEDEPIEIGGTVVVQAQ